MEQELKKRTLWQIFYRFLWKIKEWAKEECRCHKYRKLLASNQRYHNKHLGERCVIVGNGPSLTIADLETLRDKGVVTFAANRIYKMFDDTTWRPSYYGVCDRKLYEDDKKEIDELPLDKFMPLDIYVNYYGHAISAGNRINAFSRIPFQVFRNAPKFSPKLTQRLSEGGTITYHLMQIAVYMGFKEIYLIGCDFRFSFGIGVDGKIVRDHNVKDHFAKDDKKTNTMPNLHKNLKAYQSARIYADRNGIKIYNATRGGNLEVFERRNFDEVFA